MKIFIGIYTNILYIIILLRNYFTDENFHL